MSQVAPRQSCRRTPRSSRFRLLLGLLFGCCSAAVGAQEPMPEKPAAAEKPAAQQNPAPPALPNLPEDRPRLGRLIRVASPITSGVDARVRRAAGSAIAQAKQNNQWPVLFFEIQPGQSEFGKAYDLADYISKLTGATTVAYVPESVSGHALLLAMACDQIAMAPEARIGQASEPGEMIGPAKRSGYVDIAGRRRNIPADLALGMLDPELEVWEIETEAGKEFVLSSRLEELRQKVAFQLPARPLIPRGELGLFTGREGRALGFVNYLAADRGTLAKALGLPREAMADDPSLDGSWRSVRVQLKGPITPSSAAQVQRIIQEAISQRDANFICIWIDSAGGSPEASLSLANFLVSLDPAERRTVAYIPNEARSDAAFVALACDQVVMHGNAILGGAGVSQIDDDERQLTVQAIEEVARLNLRSPSLAAALVDPDLKVYRYTRTDADDAVEYMTEVEARRQPQPQLWRQGELVTEPGRLLRVDGPQAVRLRLADETVENFLEFKQLYHLESDPQLLELGWADRLIDALRSPGVAWFLLLLGAGALYAELQSPGIGIGGFLASVCFVLFFWSNYLGGTAGWLEVLLFLLGLGCLMLELFVLPGFGIFGLGGAALVVASIVLATQTFVGIPRNEYQLAELQKSLLMVVGVGLGLAVAIAAMQKLLPRAPVLGRVVLAPPSDQEAAEIARREALASFDHLLGQPGTAATQLVPAGKARIGGELYNVISSGDMIDRGTAIRVVEVRGPRIVVARPT